MNTQLSAHEIQIAQSNFISKVYAWMGGALLVTAIVALFTASSQSLIQLIIYNRFIFFGIIIAELACVIYMTSVINKISSQIATLLFFIYATLNGLTFGLIFLVYTSESIASTFMITAISFGIMSLYGYTTKRDLTSIGNLSFMALIGIILASIVNFFLQSEMLYWIITYIGVLIFVGLIAYDTQKIKRMYNIENENTEIEAKGAIMGALALYLDFINLFLFLLRIFGRRK